MTTAHPERLELRRRVDLRLDELMPPALPGQAKLDQAMRESVLAPGKRLRPILTLLVAEELGGLSEPALDAGCAVEMVHAASLILDDLPCMDDAELRRGQPTTHRAHGEDVAVLAAIAVLSAAYGTLARLRALSPAAKGECVAILADAVGAHGLVAGQFLDLHGGRSARPLSDIAEGNGLKTGALFAAAAEIGAVVAGADAAVRAELRAFASEIGLAFQLLDDLLDGEAHAGLTGKDVGKDAGKSTIVALIGPAQVERRIDRHIDAAHERLTAAFGKRSRLHALVDDIFGRSSRLAPGLPSAVEPIALG
ncbi:polyprenyl synthetase family protein [Aureimonas sp. AU4]|uniref:polyprenyl synthetase family protein n=1 Tax=Aureimonas sp. AU4 TaxID=1638163 RepID=UPI0009EC45A0|nr:polyprenyl synthetase family protein [Aureimonas sp. AU4]